MAEFCIEFEAIDNSFETEFDGFTPVSDGGYDRGYAEGYENGKGDGLTEGYAKGETDGFADALAKREELVVTENGEYTPPEGSTGFKTVSVNVQAKSAMDALIDGTITEVNSGATKVKVYAFYDNRALTIANFPNATSIGNRAFYQCLALESADFPNATSVGDYVFQSCSKLTSANFPNATSIGKWMFGYCSKLTNADFPNATSIGSSAFQQCEALTSVDISSATKINSQAFCYCYVLKSVILRSETVCTLSSTDVFAYCHHILGTVNSTYNPTRAKDGYFYVPKALVASYQSATNWSTYSTQFRALEDYTVDGTITGALDPNKI